MSCLNTRILHGQQDQLTMWRDIYGELHVVGPVAEDNYALEAWERQTYGGLRIDGFTKVQIVLNQALRAIYSQ